MKLILKAIILDADFRKSELTNWTEYVKKNPIVLGKNNTVCFVSGSGRQLVFILHQTKILSKRGDERMLLDSRRLRIDGGTWDPYMLQNYANEVDIELVGIKRFEQIIKERNFQRRETSNESKKS
jgi:hypothetical protein